MELKKENFIFIMKELLTPKFKSIRVKECAKKFKTNISDEKSNFTHEFKEKCI